MTNRDGAKGEALEQTGKASQTELIEELPDSSVFGTSSRSPRGMPVHPQRQDVGRLREECIMLYNRKVFHPFNRIKVNTPRATSKQGPLRSTPSNDEGLC